MNYDAGAGNANDAVKPWLTPGDVWGRGGDLGDRTQLGSGSNVGWRWWQTLNGKDWFKVTKKLDMNRLSIAFHRDELPGL